MTTIQVYPAEPAAPVHPVGVLVPAFSSVDR